MAAYQLYPTGVTVTEDDELLSLSICEYSSTNGRLIVLARRVGRQGEMHMAMIRNMTMAEKEVRDYAKRQMEWAEQWENIVFTEEQKEQVLEYAAMTGDDYNIRKKVRDLAGAVRSSDEERVDEILGDAREEIDGFPDRSIGMAELKGYGYTADDMFPLRQEMARELRRVGEKVYCLQ